MKDEIRLFLLSLSNMCQASIFKEILMIINTNSRQRAGERERQNDAYSIVYALAERALSAQTVPAKRTTLRHIRHCTMQSLLYEHAFPPPPPPPLGNKIEIFVFMVIFYLDNSYYLYLIYNYYCNIVRFRKTNDLIVLDTIPL